MADTKLTSLTELAATPADNDMLYIVDVSDTSDDAAGSSRKIQAKRLAKTDGNAANITGGGTIALAGYTLTAPATGTMALRADMPIQTIPLSLGESFPPTNTGTTSTYQSVLWVFLNGAAVPSSLKVYLYVRLRRTAYGAGTAYAQLYNETDSSAVSGSELTTTSDSYTWVVSGDLRAALASGLKRYALQVKNSEGGETNAFVSSAQLVITP